ncbi:hypothetical protein HYH03_001215 [Edaphochlamys debaryana]|uniref:J domain-containing protein n=1 Tax=Edaphochlamys debaryana TaxID=47281 RepID=A0A836C763_9CHLO|nr:hypothetical protein HYH03_001215 [Edaphochlamys debaryana]|eukprot:KAG2501432.1 hypothetical protein HYH03_001215 [Edaphochlamys debaryana]
MCSCFGSLFGKQSTKRDEFEPAVRLSSNAATDADSVKEEININADWARGAQQDQQNAHAPREQPPEPAMPDTRSSKLRMSANKLYAQLESLSPALRDMHIRRVRGMYQDALAAADSPLDRSAARKNLGALTRTELSLCCGRGTAALQLTVDALSHYALALEAGDGCRSADWAEGVRAAAQALAQEALDWKDGRLVRERPALAEGWPERGVVLARLHAALPRAASRCRPLAALRAWLALAEAKHVFAGALAAQRAQEQEQDGEGDGDQGEDRGERGEGESEEEYEGADEESAEEEEGKQQEGEAKRQEVGWRAALEAVGRAQPLFKEAAESARISGEEALQAEAAALLESAIICEAACCSHQARHAADAVLLRVLREGEELSTDGVHVVGDGYKEALVLARGHDLEAEARAHAALGGLYARVWKMADVGLVHYKRVLELAVALMPRVVSDTPWYREARDAVLKAQQAQTQVEEAAAAAAAQPHLDALRPQLEALSKAAEKGAHELLKLVYAQHPLPGAQPSQLPAEALRGDRLRETLRRAVVAYHPDRQLGHPMRWQVLSGEICKELSAKYQILK